ncbi:MULTISPECIES: endonuclease III [unclassified Leptolyngbya]|uniref:endonuclease III domain-containing protein n=1 Tax=unclassified Leptolyngbya TaxID=2650499 RepID=UPI0016857FCA|nr:MULTISPECIES: endonuclease III [unclassified Leptolyngbya]MBD1911440.1 endonuclease III [Leptolyngbya sp. FACHB-8]MBD2153452.1 endonuclease III [Leptolyngbya sp. FACHB-16]
MSKQSFDIDLAISKLREAVHPFPKAAMFALAEEGHRSLFEQLIACILSIRTRDETSLPVAKKLFQRANTPETMRQLSVAEIEQLIQASTFADAKAKQIWEISDRILHEFAGELPCDLETLTSFKGVGPKCANLSLGIACDYPCISVDVHVHRVTNRWGYVQTRTPEKTMAALEAKLPKEYWIEINALLVPFGKHICTGEMPHCSTCPLLEMCQQVGVSEHR